MRQIIRWALILLLLAFLSASLFSGVVLAIHTNHCCECTRPAGPTNCTVFATLLSVFQKLTVTLILSSTLLATLVLPQVSLGICSLAERLYDTSLVGRSVKFSC